MEREEKEYRVFQAVKYWTDLQLSNQKCYLDENEFFKRCNHPDLSDARCLYRMILKEVESHNSKIQSKRNLLDNLKYKPKYLSSSIFSGLKVPIKELEKLVSENTDKTPYECYRLLVGWDS